MQIEDLLNLSELLREYLTASKYPNNTVEELEDNINYEITKYKTLDAFTRLEIETTEKLLAKEKVNNKEFNYLIKKCDEYKPNGVSFNSINTAYLMKFHNRIYMIEVVE